VASLGGAGGSAVGGGSFTGAGYVDPAIPVTQYRMRVDAAIDDNRPDRADFFYNVRTLPPGHPPVDHINFQQLSNYFEWAMVPRFSVWADLPVRWVDFFFHDPAVGQLTHSGLSDVQFGFKYAILYDPSEILTFQWRTYAPTGDATTGLGRGNWNVEPALLYYRRLTSRLFFEGELEDFTPIAARDNYAGNVMTYGGSLSFLLYNRTTFRVVPVTELVGWHVFSGKETTATGAVKSAAGENIVNAKFGIRIGLGELVQPGFLNRVDFYVGYGRALTGTVWYKDIVRAEFRLRF
jgi:hypothetical protein